MKNISGFVNGLARELTLEFENKIGGILQGVVLFFVGWWIVNKICKISLVFFDKASVDRGIASFLNSVLKFSLRLLVIVGAMACCGFNVTSILAAVGASFIAIGISLKDSLSNIVGGIVLVINKPIHVGDYIEFENFSGTVIKIEMLFTTLQTADKNKTVIIPNSRLTSNNIVRSSGYNISKLEFLYTSKENINTKNIVKYINKEILISKNILQFPAPRVSFESNDKCGTEIHIEVWSQNKFSEENKINIFDIMGKINAKYNFDFKYKAKPEEIST